MCWARPGAAGSSQRIDELYGSREKLGTYARAFLAMAMQKAGAQPGDARLKTLLSDLNNAAILSATGAHWEEDEYDWWSMNTDTRSTAIVLAALVRLDPENQLNPNVVRWLMVARKDGIWETTQESAWALMALTDWMDYTGELKADYDYAAWLNNQEQTSGHIGAGRCPKADRAEVTVADLLKDTGNQLTIGRGAGQRAAVLHRAPARVPAGRADQGARPRRDRAAALRAGELPGWPEVPRGRARPS